MLCNAQFYAYMNRYADLTRGPATGEYGKFGTATRFGMCVPGRSIGHSARAGMRENKG
jgi:hypothetical protein